MRIVSIALVATTALWLSACSTVMEANRPEGVKLSTYHLGEKRVDVVSTMGAPQSEVRDGDRSCDVYSVYTSRTNGAQKAAVILGEGAADLFTVGLFEIVATPAQAAAKPSKHTVLMCYGEDNGLLAVKDNGETVVGSPTSPVQPTASSSLPPKAPSGSN
jgi:hypothetical protein